MRILFMGGKNVGHGCLRSLLDSGIGQVVGLIANPGDEDPGRWFLSASELARSRGIPVFAPAKINAPEHVELIRGLRPDVLFSVYYDQILKPGIIAIPPRGCFNLHLALAEEYRGCYPTAWALINGESGTGVTLHVLDAGIDSGDIVAQARVAISPEDTGRSLYDKCTEAGIALFREHAPRILAGDYRARPQAATAKTRHYNRDFPDREIRFDKPGREIRDHIRALLFEPFPPPYFEIGGVRYEIRRVGKDGHG